MTYPLTAITNECIREDYVKALQLIEEAEASGFISPELLVTKTRVLQLTDEETRYDLSDIEEIFRQARELDEKYIPAWVESGYFYLNILDDATRAIPLFEQAIALQKEMITETVIGLVNSLLEVKPPGTARKFVADLAQTLLESDEIREALAG